MPAHAKRRGGTVSSPTKQCIHAAVQCHCQVASLNTALQGVKDALVLARIMELVASPKIDTDPPPAKHFLRRWGRTELLPWKGMPGSVASSM
jgi:hypothetical protein